MNAGSNPAAGIGRRGIRHGVIAVTVGATAVVVVAVVGASVADGLDGGAAEGALTASRFLAGIAGIGAAASCWLALQGRRMASLTTSVIATALVITWIGLVSGRARDATSLPLLESDRAGLEEIEVDGERYVSHRTLGFRLPQPDVALIPNEEIVADSVEQGGVEFAERHQLWAFGTADQSLTVVLDLSRAEGVDRASLSRLRDAVIGSVLGSGGRGVDRGELEMHEGRCGSASYGAALGEGGRIDGRVFAFEEPRGHRAFHLAITIVGPAQANARDYLGEVLVPCD